MQLRLAPSLLLLLIELTIPVDAGWSQDRSNRADPPGGPQWEGPLLDGPVRRLFTVSTGTLLGQRLDDLQASDDGGHTWTFVPLPPAGPLYYSVLGRNGPFGLLAVDPDNPRILFGTGADPLYKSTDGGSTWRVVLTADRL